VSSGPGSSSPGSYSAVSFGPVSYRRLRDALVVMMTFLLLLWVIQTANWADDYGLDATFGILPRHPSHLADIFTAPFLHLSWQHLEGNTVPLFVLGVLAAYRGVARFLAVTLIVTATSGLAVWLFQSGGTLTVGASGLVFGYFGFVLARGLFDRNWIDIGVGAAAGLLYSYILLVAIPGTPGVSWLDHLGGLAGGVLAGWLLRARCVPSAPAAVTQEAG
jgi:membrane associated rhomboid family serine protease